MSDEQQQIIPDGSAEATKTLYRASAHFRSFTARQVENRRAYFFDDKQGQYANEAVDESTVNKILSCNGADSQREVTKQHLVVKVAGKVSHLLISHPHEKWFDLAGQDFLRRRAKFSTASAAAAANDASSSSSSPTFGGDMQDGGSKVTQTSVYNPQKNPRAVKALILAAVVLVGCFFLWPFWDFLVAVQANEHYRTLGLNPGATVKDVTKAYRELAKKLHPDRNPGCGQRCTTRWMEVAKAYEVLKGRDQSSELQVQIDHMMAQIVMFTFGDVFAIVIQAGILISGLMHRAVSGSLASSVAAFSDDMSRQQTILKYAEYVLRGSLLVCGIGLVIFTSDKNIMSVIAIGYALVQHISTGTSDSVEDIFRYRGFQVKDVFLSFCIFVMPAMLAHVVPSVVDLSADDYYRGYEGLSDVQSGSVGWTVLVALLGVSYVASAVFVANPLFLDNGVMMRYLTPADMVTALKSDDGGTAGPDDQQQFGTTYWSIFSFVLWNIVKRDVLAFALKVPGSYRLAAIMVYLASVAQMILFPTSETPLLYDRRFRRADEAAKRDAAMLLRKGNQRRGEDASPTDDSNNNNNSPTSPTSPSHQQQQQLASTNNSKAQLPQLVPLGRFDFQANDAPLPPSLHPLRMNEKERDICTNLDVEVPFWAQLFTNNDGGFTITAQEVCSNAKFSGVLGPVGQRDVNIVMQRAERFQGTGRREVTSLVPMAPLIPNYGTHLASENRKVVAERASALLGKEYERLSSILVFWILCGLVVAAFASSSSSLSAAASPSALRFQAAKIFPAQAAGAHAEELTSRQQTLGISFYGCRSNAAATSKKEVGGAHTTICRNILSLDAATQVQLMQTRNIFAQFEGFDPLQRPTDKEIEDRMRKASELVAAGQEREKKPQYLREGVRPYAETLDAKKQRQADSEGRRQRQTAHELTAQNRERKQQAAAKTQQQQAGDASGGGGGFPGFPGGGGPNGEGDLGDFMAFASKLDKRQRARGWRPKPSYAPGGGGAKKQQSAKKKTAANNPRITAGKASSKSGSGPVADPAHQGGSGDDDDESSDIMNNDMGSDAASMQQKLKHYQARMFQKMQLWIEQEAKAGRISFDMAGRVREQDHDVLIAWMLENDESWEPDPSWVDPKMKGKDQIKGPAAEELRRLRGGR